MCQQVKQAQNNLQFMEIVEDTNSSRLVENSYVNNQA